MILYNVLHMANLHSQSLNTVLPRPLHQRCIECLLSPLTILWQRCGTCAAEHHVNVFIQIKQCQSSSLFTISSFTVFLYFRCSSPFHLRAVNIKWLLLLHKHKRCGLFFVTSVSSSINSTTICLKDAFHKTIAMQFPFSLQHLSAELSRLISDTLEN